jgi:hypothetical protein
MLDPIAVMTAAAAGIHRPDRVNLTMNRPPVAGPSRQTSETTGGAMNPLIIQTIAAEQIRERTERAAQRRRVRQARAAAHRPAGHPGIRKPGLVVRLRPATPA